MKLLFIREHQPYSNYIFCPDLIRCHYSNHTITLMLVTGVKVIGCPFSDHKFLVAALDLSRAKHTPFVNIGRSLSEKKLFLIADLIKSQDFSFDKNDQNIDQIWNIHKQKILECIDLVAPLKTFKERSIEKAPWVDEELLEKIRVRDYYYFKF